MRYSCLQAQPIPIPINMENPARKYLLESALTLGDDTRIAKKAYLDSREVAPLLRAIARVAEDAVEEAEVVEASIVDRSVQTGEGLLLQTVLIVRPPARTDVLNKLDPLNVIPICLLAKHSPFLRLDK